ncbi:MAG: hypothetical protein ACTIM4_15960 [Marinomonas sp.]
MNSHSVEIQKAQALLTSIFPDVGIMTPSGYFAAVKLGVSGENLKVIINNNW